MEPAVEKIWKAVSGLEQADVHSTAMCHSIIKMMIDKNENVLGSAGRVD